MIFSRESYNYNEMENNDFIDVTKVDEQGVDMEEYNCGGFALNTRTWYHPYGNQPTFIDMFTLIERHGKTALLKKFVQNLLSDFPNLRLLKDINDLKSFETLILFRIGDDDFHFVRRENGKYYHKTGWIPEIFEI